MRFEIEQGPKRLIFDSDLHGLRIEDKEYLSGREGVLIYDQTRNLRADQVELQMSTNTSTLIPAFRTLGISYSPYFDEGQVVQSQNDITFFWKPSKLAAFYNRFSTDELNYDEREAVIRQAVEFLHSNHRRSEIPGRSPTDGKAPAYGPAVLPAVRAFQDSNAGIRRPGG